MGINSLLEPRNRNQQAFYFLGADKRRKEGTMFYGYDETTAGWQESKRHELAVRLEILRKQYPEAVSHGHPLVTNDEQGVLVRMVGRLSEEDQIKIVREADAIFVEVMGVR